MKLHLTYEFESEDELRDHLAVETRTAAAAPAPEPAPAVTPEPAPAPAPEPETDGPTRDDVDGDGMPYDAEVHSDPPTFTAKGLWRAKRGKADAEKEARAAFKAKGADVEPPAPSELPTGLPTPPAGLPASAPPPISIERMIEKINGMMTRGTITADALPAMYAEHSGVEAEKAFPVFQSNETARAKMFSALCEIEPELS